MYEKDVLVAVELKVLTTVALDFGYCRIEVLNEAARKNLLKIQSEIKVNALYPIGVQDEKLLLHRKSS